MRTDIGFRSMARLPKTLPGRYLIPLELVLFLEDARIALTEILATWRGSSIDVLGKA